MTPPVLERVPGQDQAVSFLSKAVPRPHHAYVFAEIGRAHV